MTIHGYTRVSTEEQGDSGAGISVQREQIHRWALLHGHESPSIVAEVASGADLDGRPELRALLTHLDTNGGTLVVAKLDRLSRSVVDFAGILERARRKGWAVVALDLGVDTSTPTGELVANVMISVAQWERRIIGQRTKEALEQKRAQGVQLGRPPQIRPETARRIREMADSGMSRRAIRDTLENLSIPSPTGNGHWSLATIAAIVKR